MPAVNGVGKPCAGGSSDKAATQLVRVQPCQLSVSDTKRRHCPDRVTGRVLRGVKGLAARRFWAPRSEQLEVERA